MLWKKDGSANIRSLVVGVDGTLFAYWDPSSDGHIFAIDPNNRSTIWSTDIEGSLQGANGVGISPDGDLVISQSSPNKLIKINSTTGEFIWQVDAHVGWPSISPDGSIYLLCSDLYCYNPDGTIKWQTGSHTACVPGKTAIDYDGKAYVNATNYGSGNFQVYNADGSLKWATTQNMDFCVAIGPNNVIYVSWAAFSAVGYSGTLYAIQGDKPLASSGWPRNTGGNKNSRNSNLH